MPVKSPREFFVALLSNVRNATERSENIYQELSSRAKEPVLQEILETREFLKDKTLATLDECFRLIGEEPVKTDSRLQETMLADVRKELSEIESPVARHLFILAKIRNLAHFRIAEYETLIAISDFTGNYAVGLLLETALADQVAMAERARHVMRVFAGERIKEGIQERIQERVKERIAA